ncbi:MAG: hypothetical protein PHI99_11795 [Syntrophales bacterium]|nr:hypothetical protein [Syntrophales bacterium]
MEGVIRAVSEQPLVAIMVCSAFLLLLYFFLKSLIKLLFILVLIAIVVGGAFYMKHPESRPASLKDALESARTQGGRVLDQGQEVYRKGRDMVDKGEELIDEAKAFFGKGVDQGRDAEGKENDSRKIPERHSKTGDGRRL